MACDRSLIFFLISGDDDDRDNVGGWLFCVGGWCVRNNLADFYLFRSISGVCLFFCLKNTYKKAVIY